MPNYAGVDLVNLGREAEKMGDDVVWAFNGRKRLEDFCDVVVLIANIDSQARHYVLPADHQVFYTSTGEPKAGIGITKNPRTLKKTGRTLERHYERWDLVRQIRDGEYCKPEQPMLF